MIFRSQVIVRCGPVLALAFSSLLACRIGKRVLLESLDPGVSAAAEAVSAQKALGTDVVLELSKLCLRVGREFPQAVFFAGKLVFERETFLHRFLHNQTALEMQNWLQFHGHSMVILPVRVG